MNGVINGLLVRLRYQQRNVSTIKIFFLVSNTLPLFNKIFVTCNDVFPSVSTIFKFVSESFVVVPKLCEGNMPIKTISSVQIMP